MTPAERDLLIAIAEVIFWNAGSDAEATALIRAGREALVRVTREQIAADPVGHAMRVSNDELRLD